MEREKNCFYREAGKHRVFSVFGAEMFPRLDQQQAYEVIENLCCGLSGYLYG